MLAIRWGRGEPQSYGGYYGPPETPEEAGIDTIPGATSAQYVATEADLGQKLWCLVATQNAANWGGSTSYPTTITREGVPAYHEGPLARAVQWMSTDEQTGQVRASCKTGPWSWTSSPGPVSWHYELLRDGHVAATADAPGNAPSLHRGAPSPDSPNSGPDVTFAPVFTAADNGAQLACRITATNRQGSGSWTTPVQSLGGLPAGLASVELARGAQKRATVLRTRTLTLKLSAPGGIRLTLRVGARSHGRKVTVATGAATLEQAGKATAKLRLTAAGRRALRDRRVRSVAVELAAPGQGTRRVAVPVR